MHDNCPVCGQHYEPEPGFFWGAMYISYAFSVVIVVAVGIAVYVLGHDPATWVYVRWSGGMRDLFGRRGAQPVTPAIYLDYVLSED